MAGPTLFFLENSRAFRVAWLLRELGLQHELRVYKRLEGKKAEPRLKEETGYNLGKSPVIKDGPITVVESEACVSYLIERYGQDSGLLPKVPDWAGRSDVQAWMAFSETLMVHTLAVIYARWFKPDSADEMEAKMSANIHNDLNCLEERLADNQAQFGSDKPLFLHGAALTAADIMCAFSAEYTLIMDAGISKCGATYTGQDDRPVGNRKHWPHVEKWLKGLEARAAYQDVIKAGGTHRFVLP